MSRLGWGILLGIVLVAGAFASMLSFGSPPPGGVRDRMRQAIPTWRERRESGGALLVPVAGVPRAALRGSWGDPRGGGTRGHHGIDIPAPAGTPVIAAADGTVEKLFQSVRGGTTLYVRTPDLRWVHYYAHLAGYAPGIVVGRRVRAGETIAYVGDTGDAGAGNYHLHFGVQAMAPGERWWQGSDVDPYPLLAGGGAGR
jgi:murein DD-endopeptidase MepM/ murein hydrolase activator NlpD